MDEQQFLLKLEARANEQEKLIQNLHTPKAVFGVSIWLGRHPWRFLIPFSFLLSLLLEFTFGSRYTESILWIFGGL